MKVLALEDVGTAIAEEGPIDTQMRTKMKSALARIHSAGHVDGDIVRCNFCKNANGAVLADLETSAAGRPEMEAELAGIDAW